MYFPIIWCSLSAEFLFLISVVTLDPLNVRMQVRNLHIWMYCCLLYMILGQAHTISWRIICFTSGKRIADSWANQRVILNGLHGSSQEIKLNWENGRFKHLATDVFNATTTDIGPLKDVTLWNDNSGKWPIWVVTNITFMNLDDGSVYVTAANDVYVNRSRMVSLVKTVSNPTTHKPTLSTEISSLQETTESFDTDEITTSLEIYSTEIESKTFPGTTSTESIIPTTDNISTDINISTIDIITANTIINISSTSSPSTSSSSSVTTTIHFTNATTASTPVPMCLCPCLKILSKKEQIEHLKELKKELTIEKKKTSRYIRKKISVPDNRVSAKATGYIGIVLLICPFALILAADLSTLVSFLKAKYCSSKV